MAHSEFQRTLQAAWDRLAALRLRTDAYRLLNGAATGTPGLAAEVFAKTLVVYAYGKDLRERYGDFPDALAALTGADAVVLKDRGAPDESGRGEGAALLGEAPELIEVREGPLRFQIHPRHPRNVGLFLDTRPLREKLLTFPRPFDALNLFAYTCSLGAAAALGNAGRVVNVDVSPRYLAWGRENYRANSLAEEKGVFMRMDCEKYLDYAARRELIFDAVILDPPSFSRSGGGTYAFARDYWRLLSKCAAIAGPGAGIFALSNFSGITASEFAARMEETLAGAGRRPARVAALPPAEDFASVGPMRADPAASALLAFEATLGG